MGSAFFSSICISVLYIILHVCCCTLIGYVFAKFEFRYKNLLFMLVLLTMMIPQELTFFPVYGVTKKLGILNTYRGVVFPFFISGFGVFFMRQFSAYVPNEILEAAKIDGCGNLKAFIRIAVPLLKSAISALTILAFSFIWDEFAWSKLVLSSPDKLSIPIQLSSLALSSTSEVKISELLAASVIAMIPVIILFLIFQRHFIESITQSGVKG
ncbi:MAG: carbohydrate ABC transporter permease [Oliverpabstia sp.]